jgi:hypothetical protein
MEISLVRAAFVSRARRLDPVVELRARSAVHPVDEEHAVEVIHLVLDAAGEEAVAGELVRHAALILKSHA